MRGIFDDIVPVVRIAGALVNDGLVDLFGIFRRVLHYFFARFLHRTIPLWAINPILESVTEILPVIVAVLPVVRNVLLVCAMDWTLGIQYLWPNRASVCGWDIFWKK